MTEPIIEIKNLSKQYQIGTKESYYSLRDSIAGFFRVSKKSPKNKFWALKDVNLKINAGETVGIIGRNGAGKSTLLKVLSQITPPTQGKIKIRGRVASLLEVGTGFHPELTGRENIFLNGAILGMTQKEIRKKLDEIVTFSEIEKFLDTPVKRYSSGMYVRLAFAVAAHLEPEILIVDEVLAVGDVQFQKKCLGKMQDVAKGGRTVLFVSHNLGAVNRLCQRCIMLKDGKVIADGPATQITKDYLFTGFSGQTVFEQPANESKAMNLRKVTLNPGKNSTGGVNYDEDVIIRTEYEINEPVSSALVWFQLQTPEGIVVFCSSDYDLNPKLQGKRQPGYYSAEAVIPKKWLNCGTYSVLTALNTNSETFDYKETIKFDVIDNGTTPKATFNERARNGIFQPYLPWSTKKIK